MTEYISTYLSADEYKCSCCGMLPPEYNSVSSGGIYWEVFDAFTDLRGRFGEPIPVTSGFRCPLHNHAVGGKPLSVHLFGLALDCGFTDSVHVKKFEDLVNEHYPDLRMGVYYSSKFVHIDVGYLIKPRALVHWAEGARW